MNAYNKTRLRFLSPEFFHGLCVGANGGLWQGVVVQVRYSLCNAVEMDGGELVARAFSCSCFYLSSSVKGASGSRPVPFGCFLRFGVLLWAVIPSPHVLTCPASSGWPT